MTEIPEHLLKRARAAQSKLTGKPQELPINKPTITVTQALMADRNAIESRGHKWDIADILAVLNIDGNMTIAEFKEKLC